MNSIIRPLSFIFLLVSSLSMAAQTCNPNIPLQKPDSRYTDNGDGTVTDLVTGLMWKQCSEGVSTTVTACDTGSATAYTWLEALAQARTVNTTGFAGHNDWRLPNIKELSSLWELACTEPAINLTYFPMAASSSFFWSSTPFAHVGPGYYVRDFNLYSGAVAKHVKEYADHLLLVRAGR